MRPTDSVVLSPGTFFSQTWTRDGELSGNIGVLVKDGSVTRGYRLGQGQPIEQPVYFSWTRRQAGGRRPWFLCPRCIRRVALLYLRGERWACRICCDLAYRSELELKGYRGLMKARKIQARLGGDRRGFEFPDKPPRMHWKTYERWRRKHAAAVAKSWSGFSWSRFARRLGLG
jgi:hypothetical protein